MLESMQSLFHSFIIDTMSEYRVATFSLSQSRTGVWGWSPSRLRPGYHPWKLLEFYMWFGAFWNHAVWWQLSVGRRTWYICNLAIKTEQICQLQCPRDSTVVLLLLSNEHALKSGIFGVPGLWRGTAWHNQGNPGRVATLSEYPDFSSATFYGEMFSLPCVSLYVCRRNNSKSFMKCDIRCQKTVDYILEVMQYISLTLCYIYT